LATPFTDTNLRGFSTVKLPPCVVKPQRSKSKDYAGHDRAGPEKHRRSPGIVCHPPQARSIDNPEQTLCLIGISTRATSCLEKLVVWQPQSGVVARRYRSRILATYVKHRYHARRLRTMKLLAKNLPLKLGETKARYRASLTSTFPKLNPTIKHSLCLSAQPKNLRETEGREGCYLLRTNLCQRDPVELCLLRVTRIR
jgi:hypothetical protein